MRTQKAESSDPETVAGRPDGPRRGFLASLLTSAGAVYGLVLVAGMIVISRNLTSSSIEALGVVLATLLVFFVAHVYAGAVGHLADPAHRGERVREAVRVALRDSAGLLLVGVVPILALLLGVTGVVARSDAIWLALGIDMLLLAILGWIIAASRTSHLGWRLGGAVLTAALGGVMILLKVLIH